MANKLLTIFKQFVPWEDDEIVKKIMIEQIEPLLKSQAHDEDLIYADYDKTSPMFLAAKLQSSVASYLCLAFKYAPDAVKNVFIQQCVSYQPTLMYVFHWSTVFLKEEQAQDLIRFLIEFKIESMYIATETKRLIDALELNKSENPLIPQFPLIPQLRNLMDTYNDSRIKTSIGVHSGVNWEELEEEASWGGVKMPQRFAKLSISAAQSELLKLNIIAYIHAMPFASILKVPTEWLSSTLLDKMPKGLMPPTVIYRSILNGKANGAEDFDELFQRIIYEMFTHGGIKKIPGRTDIALDVSGSMHSSVSYRGRMERIHAAILMAYMLSLVAEESFIWLSGQCNITGKEKAIKLSQSEVELLFKNIFAGRDVINEFDRTHKFGGSGQEESDCFKTIQADIQANPSKFPSSNIFLFCDGENAERVDSKTEAEILAFPTKRYIMNVQNESERGIKHEKLYTRLYRYSDYFLELLCLDNGVPNVMEKGDPASNVSFRNR